MSVAHFCSHLSKLTRGVVRVGEPMAQHTSIEVGGPSDCLCVPLSQVELIEVVRFCRKVGAPVTVIGRGTNILVSDRGIRGTVLGLEQALATVDIDGTRVTAGAGVSLPWLLRQSLGAGLVGLEYLAGIPGSVGGAVMMNAGTQQGTIGDRVRRITVYDLPEDRVTRLGRSELEFGYRSSVLQRGFRLVLAVELELETGDTHEAEEVIRKTRKQRAATQPLDYPNAGSVFRNPPGDYAGRLIEQAGLKGLRVGGAEVSRLHANFIVNRGGARASDVFRLMRQVQTRVLDHSGVQLEPEIRFVGDWKEELGDPFMGVLLAPADAGGHETP